MLGQLKILLSNTKSQQPIKEEIVKKAEAITQLGEADLTLVVGGSSVMVEKTKSNIILQ
jgi:hypothetical protein